MNLKTLYTTSGFNISTLELTKTDRSIQSNHHLKLFNEVKLTVEGREFHTLITRYAKKCALMEHLQFGLYKKKNFICMSTSDHM